MYFYNKPTKRKKKPKSKKYAIFAIVIILISTLFIRMLLNFPTVYATANLSDIKADEGYTMPWPTYGQSAVGVKGFGVLGSTANQQPRPMASVTKIITALAILEKNPLNIGEQGGDIVITETDKQLYDKYLSIQGVVVDLPPGQAITQYKALQYMLILSANNVADIGANWAFGSVDEYKQYANEMIKKLGLKSVHVDDASGFSPNTVASAEDLVRLGEYALANPIVAEIIAQETVNLPDGVSRINTNVFLNYNNNGVVGIKNGLTDEAGGVLLAAANKEIDGKQLTIITAVMGSPKYFDSQKDAVSLIDPTINLLKNNAKIMAGTTAGYYSVPWAGNVPLKTSQSIDASSWLDVANKAEIYAYPLSTPKHKGDVVGYFRINNKDGSIGQSELVLDSDIFKPKFSWKIKNPFTF